MKGGDWYQIVSIFPPLDAWRGTFPMSEDTLDLFWASQQHRLKDLEEFILSLAETSVINPLILDLNKK